MSFWLVQKTRKEKKSKFFDFSNKQNQYTKVSQLNSSFVCNVYVHASFVRNGDREHKFYKIYLFYNPNEIT